MALLILLSVIGLLYVLIIALFSLLLTYILCDKFNWKNIKEMNWILYMEEGELRNPAP